MHKNISLAPCGTLAEPMKQSLEVKLRAKWLKG